MKVIAINVITNEGISTKRTATGTPYRLASLQILTPFQSGSGSKDDGSSWKRSGYGMQVTDLPCNPDCIHEFKDVKFPATIEVQTSQDVVFGRLTTVVTGLSKLAAAA